MKETQETRPPYGVGKPLKLKDKPSALFSAITPKEFSEMNAQGEYVRAHKYGVGFTGGADFWHYHFFPSLLEPSLRDRCGEADGYIWTIGKTINQITPIDNYADWVKLATYITMAFHNRASDNRRRAKTDPAVELLKKACRTENAKLTKGVK
tara:strand:+ start:382 stop:837 length:456 start_codon:yes stop_codon:yes gene_type:complete